MLKRLLNLFKISLLAYSILTMASPAFAQNSWLEDLEFFEHELPKRHKNLFFSLTREQFLNDVDDLKKRVSDLRDFEIVVEMQKIVALVGDAHTTVNPYRTTFFHLLPISLSWFKDGLYVVAATQEKQALIGQRVISINNVPSADIQEKLKTVIPHENEAQVLNQSPQLMAIPEVLAALNIIENPDSVKMVLNREGQVTLRPSEMNQRLRLTTILDEINCSLPYYLQHREKNYWFTYDAENRILYVQYNRCMVDRSDPFTDFSRNLLNKIDSLNVEKLLFDLRFNGGGNSSIANPLIDAISNDRTINKKGHLFVVIGRRTFSSAILNALHFKNKTEAIFIGEATGGKPNHFGEVRSFRLPHSKIVVTYSTKYFTHATEDTPSLYPDIQIERSFSDVTSCVDPVYDTVVNFKEK